LEHQLSGQHEKFIQAQEEADQARDESIKQANSNLESALETHEQETKMMDESLKRLMSQQETHLQSLENYAKNDLVQKELIGQYQDQLKQAELRSTELDIELTNLKLEFDQRIAAELHVRQNQIEAEWEAREKENCERFLSEVEYLKSKLTGNQLDDYHERQRLYTELESSRAREDKMNKVHNDEISHMKDKLSEVTMKCESLMAPRIDILQPIAMVAPKPSTPVQPEVDQGCNGLSDSLSKLKSKLDLNSRQSVPRFSRGPDGIVSLNFSLDNA